MHATRRVLLTGATGFVGSHVWNALTAQGHDVVGLTRDVDHAKTQWPDRRFVCGDLGDEASVREALRDRDAAFYLVHDMGGGHADFEREELDSAHAFARAAAAAGIERIVYLGGVAPRRKPSKHLASRLAVGNALRDGKVPTLELRASMIVGHGSLSWTIVRDLAARLPAMALPRFMRTHTEPVALRDVVAALCAGLDLPLDAGGASYDLPGPEALSGREILEHTASVMGLQPPLSVEVPIPTWLASQWIRLVTRADWSVAREIVVGLTQDLLARDASYWSLIGRHDLLRFDDAARLALREERAESAQPEGVGGTVERVVSAVHGDDSLARVG